MATRHSITESQTLELPSLRTQIMESQIHVHVLHESSGLDRHVSYGGFLFESSTTDTTFDIAMRQGGNVWFLKLLLDFRHLILMTEESKRAKKGQGFVAQQAKRVAVNHKVADSNPAVTVTSIHPWHSPQAEVN